MIRDHRNNSLPERLPRLGATAWCVGALLAFAIIALIHDRNYATALELESSEAGRGLEFKAVNESGVGAAAATRLVGFSVLIGVVAICVATKPNPVRIRWDFLAVLIVLALVWSFASWAWSANRGTTSRELVRLSLFTAVAAALGADLRRLCCVLCIALAGSVAAAVGYEILTGGFKPWQADYRLTGTLHSNALAIEASVVAIIAYSFSLRGHDRKLLWYSLFLAAVALVVLTKTRTALGTVIAGVVVVHIVGRPAREWLFYATSAASLLAAGLIAATVFDLPVGRQIQKVATLGRSTGDDGTLTGRVPLWQFIWRETDGRRLQGAGYGAFWLRERTENASDVLEWFPRHSHSAYLEVLATIGFVGLAMIVSIGVLALVRATALTNRLGAAEYYAAAAILAATFVNGLTETAFVKPADIGPFVGAIVICLVLLPSRRTAANAALSSNGSLRPAAPFAPGRRTSFQFPPRNGGHWFKS